MFTASTHHTTSRPRHAAALVAATVSAVLAVALTGCSGSGGSRAAAADVQLPAKNVAQWVMPLDQYMETDAETSADEYAEDLLIEPCLEKAGYSYPVPWMDLDAPLPVTRNTVDDRLFTVQLAQEYGYHRAPNLDPSRAAWLAFDAMPPFGDSEMKVFDSCLKQVRKTQLPELAQSAQNLANGLANQADQKAQQNGTVKSDARKWKTCMRPAGVPDLPDDPMNEMPTSALGKQFGLDDIVADPNTLKAGADEIRIATLDAQCREKTGYTQAYYDAEWDAQVQLLDKNADALKRAAAAIAKHDTLAKQVIAAHAPTH